MEGKDAVGAVVVQRMATTDEEPSKGALVVAVS